MSEIMDLLTPDRAASDSMVSARAARSSRTRRAMRMLMSSSSGAVGAADSFMVDRFSRMVE